MRRMMLLIVAFTAAVAIAQDRSADHGVGGSDAAGPCGGALDTHSDCWQCFKSLLVDCESIGEAEQRRACYAGANSFLSWCLNKRTRDSDGTETLHSEFQLWPVGKVFASPCVPPKGADRVEVWIRANGEVERCPEPILETQVDGSCSVVISWPTMSLGRERFVGVVIAWFDGEALIDAVADVVELTSDVDGDGCVGGDDCRSIIRSFVGGELDITETTRALCDR